MPNYLISPKDIYSAIDDNGDPLVGGQLFTYISGSSTPADTWTDATGSQENTNPVILDSRGEASVWLSDELVYKFILRQPASLGGGEIRTVDHITANNGGGSEGLSFVTHADTETIELDGLGTFGSPLTANANVSSLSTNALEVIEGGGNPGIYVNSFIGNGVDSIVDISSKFNGLEITKNLAISKYVTFTNVTSTQILIDVDGDVAGSYNALYWGLVGGKLKCRLRLAYAPFSTIKEFISIDSLVPNKEYSLQLLVDITDSTATAIRFIVDGVQIDTTVLTNSATIPILKLYHVPLGSGDVAPGNNFFSGEMSRFYFATSILAVDESTIMQHAIVQEHFTQVAPDVVPDNWLGGAVQGEIEVSPGTSYTGGLYVPDLNEAIADKLDKVQTEPQSVESNVEFKNGLDITGLNEDGSAIKIPDGSWIKPQTEGESLYLTNGANPSTLNSTLHLVNGSNQLSAGDGTTTFSQLSQNESQTSLVRATGDINIVAGTGGGSSLTLSDANGVTLIATDVATSDIYGALYFTDTGVTINNGSSSLVLEEENLLLSGTGSNGVKVEAINGKLDLMGASVDITGTVKLNTLAEETPIKTLGRNADNEIVEFDGGSDITASNGLTKEVDDVKLGGTLNEDTTINLDGNIFEVKGTSLNVEFILNPNDPNPENSYACLKVLQNIINMQDNLFTIGNANSVIEFFSGVGITLSTDEDIVLTNLPSDNTVLDVVGRDANGNLRTIDKSTIGGGLTQVDTLDTVSIELEGLGTAESPLAANLKAGLLPTKLDKVQTAPQSVVSKVDFNGGILVASGYLGEGSPNIVFDGSANAYIINNPEEQLAIHKTLDNGTQAELSFGKFQDVNSSVDLSASGEDTLSSASIKLSSGSDSAPAIQTQVVVNDLGGGVSPFQFIGAGLDISNTSFDGSAIRIPDGSWIRPQTDGADLYITNGADPLTSNSALHLDANGVDITGTVKLNTLAEEIPVKTLGVNADNEIIEFDGGGGGSVTASNGLTKDADDIKLGGSLHENTTINLDASALQVIGNGVNLAFTMNDHLDSSNNYIDLKCGINVIDMRQTFIALNAGDDTYIDVSASSGIKIETNRDIKVIADLVTNNALSSVLARSFDGTLREVEVASIASDKLDKVQTDAQSVESNVEFKQGVNNKGADFVNYRQSVGGLFGFGVEETDGNSLDQSRIGMGKKLLYKNALNAPVLNGSSYSYALNFGWAVSEADKNPYETGIPTTQLVMPYSTAENGLVGDMAYRAKFAGNAFGEYRYLVASDVNGNYPMSRGRILQGDVTDDGVTGVQCESFRAVGDVTLDGINTEVPTLALGLNSSSEVVTYAVPSNPPLPLTNKGDLLSYSTASAILQVGADGQFLVADSNEATGLKYVDLPVAPRVTSITSTATLTVDSSTTDQAVITAQSGALTIASPTGSPADGQKLIVRIKAVGVSVITWDTIFRQIGTTLPVAAIANKTIYVASIYNSLDSRWDVVAVAEES
jgi:hypothetical protein